MPAPRALALLAGAMLFLQPGCGDAPTSAEFLTPDRMSHGLVVILPGIEGESSFNQNIRRGLVRAGIDDALPIYHWGSPVPGVGMLLNQMDFVGNRLAGARIARFVEDYQDRFPGKPVYIVGHSGGGGVAVFAAEGLEPGRKVDGLVLLSASIWAGYDLTKALANCRNGIVNFYNPDDVGLLAIGTTVTSNVDGMRGPSAGLNGFDSRKAGLYQVRVSYGAGDPHTAATHPGYVSTRVAPWVAAASWPAGPAQTRGSTVPPADLAFYESFQDIDADGTADGPDADAIDDAGAPGDAGGLVRVAAGGLVHLDDAADALHTEDDAPTETDVAEPLRIDADASGSLDMSAHAPAPTDGRGALRTDTDAARPLRTDTDAARPLRTEADVAARTDGRPRPSAAAYPGAAAMPAPDSAGTTHLWASVAQPTGAGSARLYTIGQTGRPTRRAILIAGRRSAARPIGPSAGGLPFGPARGLLPMAFPPRPTNPVDPR
jgi:hypothetical protein